MWDWYKHSQRQGLHCFLTTSTGERKPAGNKKGSRIEIVICDFSGSEEVFSLEKVVPRPATDLRVVMALEKTILKFVEGFSVDC